MKNRNGEHMSFVAWISYKIEEIISLFFYWLGDVICNHPMYFIVIPIIFTLGLSSRLAFPYKTEVDNEDLYTPQDSVSFQQRIFVEQVFGFDDVTGLFFLEADSILSTTNTNQQNQQALLSFLSVYDAMTSVNVTTDGETVTYASRCNTTINGCQQVSVLNFFNFNATMISNDQNVMGTINAGLAAASAQGLPQFQKHSLFGGAMPDDNSTTLMSANVLAFQFLFINKATRINGDLNVDTARVNWEVEAPKVMRAVNVPVGRVFVFFEGEVESATASAISGDISLLPAGYFLLIVYSTFVLVRRSSVYSNGLMATASFVAVGMAIVCMWAFGVLLGLDYGLVVQASFFLLVGLGIDDTFVVMAAYRFVGTQFEPKIRIQRALSIAGVSITLTSITDAVAFGSGTFTALPAIKIFCIFTLFGVVFDFIFQVTFVVAILYYNAKREQAGRYELLPCLKAQEPNKKMCSNEDFDHNSIGFTDKFIGEWLSDIILHPAGKVIVLLLTIGLCVSSIYAATLVPTEFSISSFIPKGSPVKDSIALLQENFGGQPVFASMYTGPTLLGYNNRSIQMDMTSMSADLDASPNYDICTNWWNLFNIYVSTQSPGNITMDGTIKGDAFYPLLFEFLRSDFGARSNNFIIFNETTSTIQYSQIICELAKTGNLMSQVTSLRDIRGIADNYPQLGGTSIETNRGIVEFPFAYNFVHLFIDGLIVIREETLRNVLIAFIAVGIVSMLLLANFEAVFIVLLMLVLVDANVLGFMFYIGVDFNSVSAINLIIAVGLAIDGSVHIAHAFLISHGTRTERAKKAMQKLGASVFHGYFSTFLVMLPLVFAKSFIFQVFFQLLSLILLFAAVHALLVLPVILSLVGPNPYPEKSIHADEKENEQVVGEDEKQTSKLNDRVESIEHEQADFQEQTGIERTSF
eukprot:m.73976 g.73976  ORF g.73976 m.73976 type:complete len:921 (-) comp8434_c0_seq8:982-3744(-)